MVKTGQYTVKYGFWTPKSQIRVFDTYIRIYLSYTEYGFANPSLLFWCGFRSDDGMVCFCLAWYKGQFKPSPTDIRHHCSDHELWHCLGIAAGACASHAARRHRAAVAHRRCKLPSSIDTYGIYASPPACHYRCWRQLDGRCIPSNASHRPSAVRHMSGCWAGRTLLSRSTLCLKAVPVVTSAHRQWVASLLF